MADLIKKVRFPRQLVPLSVVASQLPSFAAMLVALCAATGLPADVPLCDLSGLQQRILFEGTGDRWIDVEEPGPERVVEIRDILAE